jgi:hypothetical protein
VRLKLFEQLVLAVWLQSGLFGLAASPAQAQTTSRIALATPSPTTARFEQCMTGGDLSGNPMAQRVAVCLRRLGYVNNASTQTAAYNCVRGEIVDVPCLNEAFKPLGTPTPSPTKAPPQPTTPPTAPATPTASTAPTATTAPTPTPTPTPTPSPTPTPTPTPWFPPTGGELVAGGAAALLIVAVIVIVVILLTRHPNGEHKVPALTITRPKDGTIAVAGRPVVFTAKTMQPHLDAKISWSVTTRPEVRGVGATFSYTFDVTGVEQVVAHLNDLPLDDVIVYVFKTPSGGSTVADLLEAEPPPVARSASSFVRYGVHATTIGRAS